MPKALRVVRAPGDCLGLTLPKEKPLNVQRFLSRIGSGLARVRFRAPDDLRRIVDAPARELWAAEWVEHCCRFFRRSSPRWLLTILQAENGTVCKKKTLPVGWYIRHVPGPAKSHLRSGERLLRTKAKSTYLAVKGNWRMMAAAGFSIPDPGVKAHFTTELYLGFPRQVYYAACWLDERELEFRMHEASATLPKVTLYAKGSRTPESVVCGDRYAYKVLRYTPNERVMPSRAKVYRYLSKRGGQTWSMV